MNRIQSVKTRCQNALRCELDERPTIPAPAYAACRAAALRAQAAHESLVEERSAELSARVLQLRRENERLAKALHRIRSGLCSHEWRQPQTGALTSEAEREILRLARLALTEAP